MSVSPELGTPREVELSAGTIQYRERGRGQPIVFVHGIVSNGDLWRDVVPSLAGRYRCIAPDWPFGSHRIPLRRNADFSPPGLARLIAEFAAELDLEEVTLVANDYGGALSQLVLAYHRERIGQALLTSCDTFRQLPPRYFKPLRMIGKLPETYPLMWGGFRQRLPRETFLRSVAHRRLPAEIVDSYVSPFLDDRDVMADFARLCAAVHPRYTLAAAKRLPSFSRPVVVAWAADDLWFARRNGERLAGLFPRGRFVLVPHARTFVPEDAPERVAQLVEELQRTGIAAPAVVQSPPADAVAPAARPGA